MDDYELTEKQMEAMRVLSSDAVHAMLFGGSRSGKTFLHIRNIILRAMKAPGSRHCILRFRFNHIKSSIVYDTFPKVMSLAFPKVEYKLDKTDWYARLPNKSEIWFGGLDDKERTEKILGNEYVTIYLNECSQISWSSRNIVLTRLAQKVNVVIEGAIVGELKPRFFYDCNPPKKSHWTYKLFIKKIDPETKEPLTKENSLVSFKMNPNDNKENLSEEYLDTLEGMPDRLKKRFLYGDWGDDAEGLLFPDEVIDTWRVEGEALPDFVRIVVAVDPSGADEEDNADNDEIGIVVGGLGTDGNAYILEDCTVKAGPATWGKVATTAYDRHSADIIVGEQNFGGAMVKYVIQSSRPNTPYKILTASRGKHVRAEPISVLYSQGKVRHVGRFLQMEEELSCFTPVGYVGDQSPNRADALIWLLTELFPGIIKKKTKKASFTPLPINRPFANR